MDTLFALAKELASPKTWSAGVELARNGDFHEEATSSLGEREFLVLSGVRGTSQRVSLSEDAETWQCNCESEEDPCAHVIATIIAVRQAKTSSSSSRALLRDAALVPARITYLFTSDDGYLSFSRHIVRGEQSFPVRGSLTATIDDILKRSIGIKHVAATHDELMLDHVLGSFREGRLPPKTVKHLIRSLAKIQGAFLDGEPVVVLDDPLLPTLVVEDTTDGGFVIRREVDRSVTSYFQNGAAVVSSVTAGEARHNSLVAVEDSGLSADEVAALAQGGLRFAETESIELASRILPSLSAKIRIAYNTKRLTRARPIPVKLVFETVSDARGDSLTVIPHLVYGEPKVAEVVQGRLTLLSSREVPIRDVVSENTLLRELSSQFGMKLGEGKQLLGEQGALFLARSKRFLATGSQRAEYSTACELYPTLEVSEDQPRLIFKTEDGQDTISLEDIQHAECNGSSFIQGNSGRWVSLPKEWLRKHGEIARVLLNDREGGRSSIGARVGALYTFCEETNIKIPAYLNNLKESLTGANGFRKFALPPGFTAELREYQKHGVNWLGTLRTAKVGALLADDMGLGKTVQAIAHITPRTLVIVPTSVLYSWEKQLNVFRPTLTVCRYHGASRCFNTEADVVLTTYTVCRMELELFCGEVWSMVILDEAQTIRNPDSLISRAVRKLRGDFRICLSGTPVENSLKDLWSQSEFLNPGLLGTYTEFSKRYASIIDGTNSDQSATERLRASVQPFILRRLKRDVARELPPKTEVVLECELNSEERTHYESVLLAARKEVVAQLEDGASPLGALELLLRLRQACCHRGLLPGVTAPTSSKIDLLKESLVVSKELGHRALVFSQWTSLLDLVEPHLQQLGISFSRIDGTTNDRDSIVDAFQKEGGPDVLLLSLKAGGVGLTLTAADHVYILDPWWNPAVEDQASDRAHRIGQENPVVVYRLVAQDSVEERVLELQNRKRAMLSAAVGDTGAVSLSKEELLYLLLS